MPKKPSRQQIKRQAHPYCFLCGEACPFVLDCHRIFEGENGGVYDKGGRNLIVACATCHRKVHAGLIVMDRKYLGSDGRWHLRYWEGGVERWKPEEFGPPK